MSKKLIGIIVAALVVVLGVGGVSAYFMIFQSDKAQYFKAEQSTFEFMEDKLSEQFESELEWNEKAQETPVDSSVELSAEYEDPDNMANDMGDMFDIEDIVNNSSLTLNSQTDLEEHKSNMGLEMDVASFELKDFNVYLDDSRLVVDLPFLDDSLQITDEALNESMQEIDPDFKDADINFESFFESAQGLPDEEIEDLKEDYIVSIYDDLPKDAFDSEKETIEVDGEDVKAKKITMDLSEEQVKEMIISILEKAEDDEDLQEIIKDRMQAQMMGVSADSADVDLETDVDELFDEGIPEAIDAVEDDLHMPEGITSTIWVDDKKIAKRDLNVSVGNGDEAAELLVEGTNALEDEQQKYDYQLSVVDPQDEKYTADVTADWSMKDDEVKDTIEISAADMTLAYNEEGTIKDGDREFERTLNFAGPQPGMDGSLIWTGNSSFDGDKMSSENEFTVDSALLGNIDASLFADATSEVIKEVEEPDEDNVKDLGDMSADELEQYIEEEVAPEAQEWAMNQFGTGLDEFEGAFDEDGSIEGASEDPSDEDGDKEDFEDADEETTTFETDDTGIVMTAEVSHKEDMVTKYEEKTTINYEDAGMEKEEIKDNLEAESQEMEDFDGVKIDSDYGDDEVEQTMTLTIEEGELDIMKQLLGDTGSTDFVSYDALTEFMELQGFEEK